MAKDDYHYLVFKLLVYYYGLLKRLYVFDEDTLYKSVIKTNVNQDYLIDVFRLMQNDGYIEGLKLK